MAAGLNCDFWDWRDGHDLRLPDAGVVGMMRERDMRGVRERGEV